MINATRRNHPCGSGRFSRSPERADVSRVQHSPPRPPCGAIRRSRGHPGPAVPGTAPWAGSGTSRRLRQCRPGRVSGAKREASRRLRLSLTWKVLRSSGALRDRFCTNVSHGPCVTSRAPLARDSTRLRVRAVKRATSSGSSRPYVTLTGEFPRTSQVGFERHPLGVLRCYTLTCDAIRYSLSKLNFPRFPIVG